MNDEEEPIQFREDAGSHPQDNRFLQSVTEEGTVVSSEWDRKDSLV